MSIYDDLGIKPRRLLLVSRDLALEFKWREREIRKLESIGAHPIDLRAQRKQLIAWVERLAPSMAGFHPIAVPA